MGTAERIAACGAALCVLGMCVCTCAPAAAQAATASGVQLAWHAPEQCPSEAQVLARVAEYVGEHGASAHVDAEATVERVAEDRYSLALTLKSTGARRELTASTCDRAAEAAALLIAIAIDPSLAVLPEGAGNSQNPDQNQSQNQSQSQNQGQNPNQNPDPNPDQSENQSQGKEITWDAAVLAVLDLSSMPGASFGLAALGNAKLSFWRFGLAAELFSPAEGNVSQIPTATVSVSAFMARASVCPAWMLGDLELGPCAFGEIGRTSGEARGIAKPLDGSALWLALGLLAQARVALGSHFNLLVEAGAALPGTRRRFLVRTDNGDVSLFQATAVSPRFGLGISYEF